MAPPGTRAVLRALVVTQLGCLLVSPAGRAAAEGCSAGYEAPGTAGHAAGCDACRAGKFKAIDDPGKHKSKAVVEWNSIGKLT